MTSCSYYQMQLKLEISEKINCLSHTLSFSGYMHQQLSRRSRYIYDSLPLTLFNLKAVLTDFVELPKERKVFPMISVLSFWSPVHSLET